MPTRAALRGAENCCAVARRPARATRAESIVAVYEPRGRGEECMRELEAGCNVRCSEVEVPNFSRDHVMLSKPLFTVD